MRNFLSYWTASYPRILVYMLQSSEYRMTGYMRWWLRTKDFSHVMLRGRLEPTSKAILLLRLLQGLYIFGIGAIVIMLFFSLWRRQLNFMLIAFLLVVVWPVVEVFAIVGAVVVGELFIQGPRERKLIEAARVKATSLKGKKIAVVGSYGKTSMKEMLATILSEKFTVNATPGNKNTPLGTAEFLDSVSGNEQIVIFEFGESGKGDINQLCGIVQPSLGIITGIAEAHLETFGSRDALIGTIFELVDHLDDAKVYKNADSRFIAGRTDPSDPLLYSISGCHGWQVSGVAQSLSGIEFVASRGEETVRAHSALIGEHHIGPLMACIDIASSLGMLPAEIEAGIANTKPFEHRMQPYRLAGATIIDDTYNGNPAGVYSGLDLLKNCQATRRVYVTPGLVELGEESAMIHEEIGRRIAESADIVVLMKNSTTADIERGITGADYKGKITVISKPLQFYSQLEQFVAAGDVVLMQNDWTDNYH